MVGMGGKMRKAEKVEIVVSEGHNFSDGAAFTSVDYDCYRYGGASPCRTTKEISKAIRHARETILRAGDIPILVDKRQAATLSAWG